MFIVGGIYFPTAGVTQQMLVNGSVVFLKAKSSIAADYHGGASIMVNQGDVITATDTTSSLVLSYFVPFA